MDPDKLRAALAKQKIAVAANDPILDVGTICEIALAEAVVPIRARLEGLGEHVAHAADEAVSRGKRAAEDIVTSASEWIAEHFKAQAGELTARVIDDIVEHVDGKLDRAERAQRMAMRAAWVAAGACVASVAAVAGIVLAAHVG